MGTEAPPPPLKTRRDVTINLRAPEPVRALIDTAAGLVGKTRSEFMLESARRCAEDVLLDQRLIAADPARYAAFLKLLDDPPPPAAALKRLMSGRPPWER